MKLQGIMILAGQDLVSIRYGPFGSASWRHVPGMWYTVPTVRRFSSSKIILPKDGGKNPKLNIDGSVEIP